jgi:hydroxymethylbilane synthase
MHSPLRIGTRGSQLALWQARSVATRLEAHSIESELVIVRTSGDRFADLPLDQIGGKGVFVKELEDALLQHEIDLAVHSAKDMPSVLPDGLVLAAALAREDPRDAIVLPKGAGSNVAAWLSQRGGTPRIGTSSLRRTVQVRQLFPGATFAPIRGNVGTRIGKLDAGEFDAIVLAAAGLRRLGLAERISSALATAECVPAPGQGIIGVETRADDEGARRAAEWLHDRASGAALAAEQTVVVELGGGCQLPLGALALIRGDDLDLHAIVCSRDGSRIARAHTSGSISEAAAAGRRAAADLARQGAVAMLDEIRQGND